MKSGGAPVLRHHMCGEGHGPAEALDVVRHLCGHPASSSVAKTHGSSKGRVGMQKPTTN